MTTEVDRMLGSFFGSIVGDAFGSKAEFSRRDTYEVSPDMEINVFGLPPGSFTDDTSMMLCLATSLIQGSFDPVDQMVRYADWKFNGYLSSSDERGCFDIGQTTSSAIDRFVLDIKKYGQPLAEYYGNENSRESGNGGIMRLTPIPIVYRNDMNKAKQFAVLSSKITHASPECLNAAIVMTDIIVRLLKGSHKDDVLSTISTTGVTSKNILDICRQTYLDKEYNDIHTTGYVVHTLEAALWAFQRTNSFEEGIMTLAVMGDDVDTVCCVYGAIAGAYYGYQSIPPRWKDVLVKKELLMKIAIEICTVSI